MTIAEHIGVIKEFHQGHGDYGEPGTDAERSTYAEQFGEPLPPELAELLEIVGGGPFFGMELLDVQGVVRVRQDWDKVASEMTPDDDADYVAYPPDRVAKRYWQPGWIPFLTEDSGSHGFAVDTAPLAGGRAGQIVNFGPDDYVRYVCADSLAEFLARVAAEVRAGRVEWRDGFGHFQAADGGNLLDLYAQDPSPSELVRRAKEDRRRAAEVERANRAAEAASKDAAAPAVPAADPSLGPLRVQLHADGGIQTTHSSSEPAHIDTRAVAGRWVRFAVQRSQPVEISGPLAEPLVATTVEQFRTAAGTDQVTVTEATPAPVRKGWTTLMWAAAQGRLDLVQDLLDRGADPRAVPRPLGSLLWGTSAYELAMAGGHVPVLQALRQAGVPNPVWSRPPDGAEAVVLRARLGRWPYVLGAVTIAAGLIIGLLTRTPEATFTLTLMGAAFAVFGVIGNWAVGRSRIAVAGHRLWTRRNLGWRGPVDLTELIAVGLRESGHPRTPSLLRMGNAEHGFPVRTAMVRTGFDEEQVAELTEREAKVLTVYLPQRFFRPGLERYVGSQIDRSRTTVSQSAERTLFPNG